MAALVFLLCAVVPAAGQGELDEIDAIFRSSTRDEPGCVVAVSHHGKLVVHRAYGSADLERNVPLSSSSVFDVGSVRKQFVAAAVLLLVDNGELGLADDIRKHIAELPDTGHVITVDHLLTHTSGIRDWTGIARFSGKDEDALTMIMRQRGLNFPPGEEWSYSNSGYVLLTELVARTSGKSFAEFVEARLFEPLEMKSTRYVEDMRSVVEHRALAYEKQGDHWKLAMLLDNDRGGGGALLSTAGDLITWNEALTSSRLGEFVSEKLQEPATLNNGRKIGYARGLSLTTNRGGKVVWHTGSAAGYKSMLARYPEQELSIAILCNGGESEDRSRVARRIYDLIVPASESRDATEKVPVADAVEVDLNGRAGLYLSEGTAEPLRLIVRGDVLMVAGGPRLVPRTKDRFRNPTGSLRFRSQDEFELRFLSPNEIELESMEGETTRYHRAVRHVVKPADLESLTGRYESAEIGVVFRIVAAEGGLVVHLEHSPDTRLQFRPIARDLFQRARMTMRFRRDETGEVVAVAYSNPMLRDIELTRLSDQVRGARRRFAEFQSRTEADVKEGKISRDDAERKLIEIRKVMFGDQQSGRHGR